MILMLVALPIAHCHGITRRQVTTPANIEDPSNEDSEDDSTPDCDQATDSVPNRALIAAEYFPQEMTRERALAMLKRAVELIEKPPSKRPCREGDIDRDAKNALRFLTGDPRIGSTTDESSQSSSTNQGSDFCPEELILDRRRVSDATVRNIIKLVDQGRTEKGIRSQYRWFHRQYVPRMRQHIQMGGSRLSTYDDINSFVLKKIDDAMVAKLPVHEYHLRMWGFERADEIGADNFKASSNWIANIKRRADLVGRKVTDLSSRPDRANADKIEASKIEFTENFRYMRQFYPHHRILNVDQSGHKYEISNIRSLARRGTRDHVLAIDSYNKNTHSYTVQPIVGRDGKLRGKLLVCFKEQKNEFGKNVEQRIRELEEDLGNVVAFASTSGKMTRELTNRWVEQVLQPAIREIDAEHPPPNSQETELSVDSQATIMAGPSWSFNPPSEWTPEQRRIMAKRRPTSAHSNHSATMLVVDSWGGHSSDNFAEELLTSEIFALLIPKRTTGDLQPLDVQVFRQYKIFVKRIIEAASYEGILKDMTDRYNILTMHSLIWDQFHAPVYRDMFLWAWRHTDPDFDPDELEASPPPRMVLDIQFEIERKHRCEVPDCEQRAFIRCAHCSKHLCLQHFLARKCFHRIEKEFEQVNGNSTTTVSPRDSDDDGSSGPAAGAAGVAGAAGTGSAVAIAGGIAVGSGGAVVGAGSALGTAGSAGSSRSASDTIGQSSQREDAIPLLPLPKAGYLESVEVKMPPANLGKLIRDRREVAPTCKLEYLEN